MTALTGIFIGLALIALGFLLGRMQADQKRRDSLERHYEELDR